MHRKCIRTSKGLLLQLPNKDFRTRTKSERKKRELIWLLFWENKQKGMNFFLISCFLKNHTFNIVPLLKD